MPDPETGEPPSQEFGNETNAEGGEGNPPVSVTPTASKADSEVTPNIIHSEVVGEKETVPDSETGESPEQKRLGPLFPRSELAEAIQILFIGKHDASAGEICSMLDEKGLVELPEGWKNSPKDRSFEDAYNSDKKDMIDKYISRVRTRMKKHKIL